MNTKELLYLKCQEALQSRLRSITDNISDLEQALQSETKSTAGDKHETGRAMIQIERERAGQQLLEIQTQFKLLKKVNAKSIHLKAVHGSVVFTSQQNYFIAVSCGEIIIDDQKFYAVSPITPIGRLLLSKAKGDLVTFRESSFIITKIL
ncbi:MAG: hypothetical protein Tsb0033_00300 [Winogradskyella sp.]